MTSLWRYCRDQYDRVIRIAGTVLAGYNVCRHCVALLSCLALPTRRAGGAPAVRV